MSFRRYPPSEFEAGMATRAFLLGEITAVHISAGEAPWLFNDQGAAFLVILSGRQLEAKFEVFGIGVLNEVELSVRVEEWRPPPLSGDMPVELRILLDRRPSAPIPPQHRKPWPLVSWRVEVLRRSEYIVEDVEGTGAVGEAPNAQDAAAPGHIPSEAAAACDVDVALLFSGKGGERLLIGAAWMPYHFVTTSDAREIDEYIASCELLQLRQ